MFKVKVINWGKCNIGKFNLCLIIFFIFGWWEFKFKWYKG